MADRLETLRQMLAEDPDDPFLAYGVALEIAKTDIAGGIANLRQLVESHPDYLPSYYRLGAFLSENNLDKEAIAVLLQGIDLAKVQKDTWAERELRGLLDEISFE